MSKVIPGALLAGAVGAVGVPVGFFVLSGNLANSILFGAPIGAFFGFFGYLRASRIGRDEE